MKQENELGLRISAKYNRIYVHRTTLKAIGNPEFVSLGIHPKSKKLVVLAAEECDKEAMRVRYTEDNIFADQQKHVKALSSFETFKAHIEADDPKQKMIEAIVQSYGLAITSTKAKNSISAVSTLERIYDKYGQAVLDTTLRLAIATWEGENNSLSGSILMGIARIVVAYGDSLKEDVFKDHVGRVSVKAIIRAAKERRPGALGYSEAMIIEYNKKSKFRLSLKTLYGGKQTSDEDEFGEE